MVSDISTSETQISLQKYLEKTLKSLCYSDGSLCRVKIAAKLGISRQALTLALDANSVSPAVAWLLIDKFPDTISRIELTPYVRQWSR